MTPGAVSGSSPLLSADLLERVGGIAIVSRLLRAELRAGVHSASFLGAGTDFVRHREYRSGDPLRHLDWRLYARTGRLWVREFRDVGSIPSWLLLDATASMGFAPEGGARKLRVAAVVAALLAHLLLNAGDPVGVVTVRDRAEFLVPPRSRGGQEAEIIRVLEGLSPLGTASLEEGIDMIGEYRRGRSRIFLLSDFLDPDSARTATALARLRARGDEVIAMEFLSGIERGEVPIATGVYADPEHPEHRHGASAEGHEGYRRGVARHREEVRRRFAALGVAMPAIRTDADPIPPLVGWFRERQGGS